MLLTGAFAHRLRTVGWRWPGAAEFFRLSAPSSSASNIDASTAASRDRPVGSASSGHPKPHISVARQTTKNASVDNNGPSSKSLNSLQQKLDSTTQQPTSEQGQAGVAGKAPPAAFVQPLYISKVNTCFQLLLVGSCLTQSWYAWPPQEAVFALGVVTGGTTLASCGAYVRAYINGTIK